MAFLFVFFFWDSYDSNVGAFNIVPEVSEAPSNLYRLYDGESVGTFFAAK